MTILQFINIVRAALGNPPAVAFDLSDAEPGSESECVLALALGCEIGAASDPDYDGGAPQFVMRFPSIPLAQRVARATGCVWCEPLPCVLLPDTLADIVAGFDDGAAIDSTAWYRTPLRPREATTAA